MNPSHSTTTRAILQDMENFIEEHSSSSSSSASPNRPPRSRRDRMRRSKSVPSTSVPSSIRTIQVFHHAEQSSPPRENTRGGLRNRSSASDSGALSESDILDVMAIDLTVRYENPDACSASTASEGFGSRGDDSLLGVPGSISTTTTPSKLNSRKNCKSHGSGGGIRSPPRPPMLPPPKSDRATRTRKDLFKDATERSMQQQQRGIGRTFLPPLSPSRARNMKGLHQRGTASPVVTSTAVDSTPIGVIADSEPWPSSQDEDDAAFFDGLAARRRGTTGNLANDDDVWPEESFDSPFGGTGKRYQVHVVTPPSRETERRPSAVPRKEFDGEIKPRPDTGTAVESRADEEATYDEAAVPHQDASTSAGTPHRVSPHRGRSPSSVACGNSFNFEWGGEPAGATATGACSPNGYGHGCYSQQQPHSSGTLSLSSSEASSTVSQPIAGLLFALDEQDDDRDADDDRNDDRHEDDGHGDGGDGAHFNIPAVTGDAEAQAFETSRLVGRKNKVRLRCLKDRMNASNNAGVAPSRGTDETWDPWDAETIATTSSKSSSSAAGSF